MRYRTTIVAMWVITVLVFIPQPACQAEPAPPNAVAKAAEAIDAPVAVEEAPPTNPQATQTSDLPDEPGVTVIPQMTLVLADGSQLKGSAQFHSVPIQTPFARVDVPLLQLRHIQFLGPESALLQFRNGDRLTGKPLISKIDLQSLVGNVTVSTEHVVRVTVADRIDLSHKLRDSLVLYYSFDSLDEGVIDQSGKDNHGVNYGAKFTEQGTVNGAFAFDGMRAFVRCEDHPSLDLADQMTIAFWVKPRAPTADYAAQLLFKAERSPRKNVMISWYYFGTGRLAPYFTVGGSWKGSNGIATEPGKWYQLAATFDGKSLVFYKDGEQIEVTEAEGKLATNDQPLLIAKGWGRHHGRAANVLMDELMIFNAALRPDQIRALYNAQRQGSQVAASQQHHPQDGGTKEK